MIRRKVYDNNICLKKEEIMTVALDHHCTNICSRLQNYIDYDIDELKSLIWENSSSVNTRIYIDLNQIENYKVNNNWKIFKNLFELETLNIKNGLFMN